MSADRAPGRVYRCPVCGAEVMLIGGRMGRFEPHCCNTAMLPTARRAVFYRCPVCGAEIAVVNVGGGCFEPRCCNTDMEPKAA